MLHAFNYTFPATSVIADAARKRFGERSPSKIEIDADFLDLVRVSEPGHSARMAAFLRDKYARTPPDVIMALGSAALPFVVEHRDAFAPKVPVVFASVSPANHASSRPPPDVTGILTEFDLDKTLALAERLQPAARQLFVIAGTGATDRRWHSVARRAVESRERKFETTFLFELPYDELVAALTRVPRDAIVVLLSVFADGTGKTFVPAEVAAALAPISPAPVYAPYDTYLGGGIVGGFMETFESVGTAAADLVLEILSGKDPATLPPRTNPGQAYRVDFRALQRWGLDESRLPTGTLVLHKPPNVWDQHRDLILAALLIFAVQTAFLVALVVQRRQRRVAEHLLDESEERMRFAAAAVNIGLWQFDLRTDELWATDHCRAMFGLDRDVRLTRETFLAAVHPEDRELALSSLREVSTPGGSVMGDVRVILPGDQVRWVRVRARSHSDGPGAPSGVSGIFIDVTEQKDAEAESALQRQEVTHLMRVSALGQLSGAIAHEINQPLTAILSNAQAALHMAREDAPNIAEIREALADIIHEDNRAGEVIERLRTLLKKGELTSEAVDVNALVRSNASLLNSELISRRTKIELDLAPSLPSTSGDPVQLQQVLLNLVMNAMDAMAGTPVPERLVRISTRATRTGAIEVLVRDRGSGISPDEKGRVFEPFYTTKNHGLGLGLTISSTIAQAHGGKLTLAGDESGGAVAALSLPAQEMQIAAQ
jgi:PAS domain S-box-containing protein